MEKIKNEGLRSAENAAVEPNNAELSRNFSNKVKFPLWVFPETMERVDTFSDADNCRSKSEFIEKAINFYIGYLKAADNVNYLAQEITKAVDAVIHGTERRINRNLFKIAVELGKLSHMVAAANEVSNETLTELHEMCLDEVKRINGAIDFESAVKFQQGD